MGSERAARKEARNGGRREGVILKDGLREEGVDTMKRTRGLIAHKRIHVPFAESHQAQYRFKNVKYFQVN